MRRLRAARVLPLLSTVMAIARKDLSVWLRRPVAIFTTLVPSIMYILVVYFISAAIGKPPVALVVSGQGPQTARLASIITMTDAFTVTATTADDAQRRFDGLDVAAVITIPSDFDARFAAGTADPVGLRVDNVNQDIASDIRRSFGDVLTQFYLDQPGNPLRAVTTENDTHSQDISLAQFRMVPGLVLILLVAGVVNTGLATCQEFEARTIKELSLSPTPRWCIIAGKIVGGWLTTVVVGLGLAVVGVITGLLRPPPAEILPTVVMALLIGLAGSAIGVATGTVLRRFQLVTSVSVAISLYLFFLSGGVSVPGFLPDPLRVASHFVPVYYGIDALEQAVLNSSVAGYWGDILAVAALAVAGGVAATLALRRPLSR